MKFHWFDENVKLLLKWLSLINKVIPFDGNSSLWWKSITLIKVLNFKESWPLWLKLIASIKIGFLMKIHHFDEISSFWWKFVSLEKNSSHHCIIFWKFNIWLKNPSIWWKMVTMMEDHDSTQMKILMKFHYYNENILIW